MPAQQRLTATGEVYGGGPDGTPIYETTPVPLLARTCSVSR